MTRLYLLHIRVIYFLREFHCNITYKTHKTYYIKITNIAERNNIRFIHILNKLKKIFSIMNFYSVEQYISNRN